MFYLGSARWQVSEGLLGLTCILPIRSPILVTTINPHRRSAIPVDSDHDISGRCLRRNRLYMSDSWDMRPSNLPLQFTVGEAERRVLCDGFSPQLGFLFSSLSPVLNRVASVDVLCDAAAMVTLLAHSRKSDSHRASTRTCSANEAEEGYENKVHSPTSGAVPDSLWSPYQFGIRYRGLEACAACMKRMDSIILPKLQSQAYVVVPKCECRWFALVR